MTAAGNDGFPRRSAWSSSRTSSAGGTRGFSIFEADDEARLVEFFTHYFPEVMYRIEPIFHMATVVEAYTKRA